MHMSVQPHIEQLIIRPHDTFSQILSHTYLPPSLPPSVPPCLPPSLPPCLPPSLLSSLSPSLPSPLSLSPSLPPSLSLPLSLPPSLPLSLPLSPLRLIQQILDDVDTDLTPGEKHLPALTTTDRKTWAETRERFFMKGKNKISLETINKVSYVSST